MVAFRRSRTALDNVFYPALVSFAFTLSVAVAVTALPVANAFYLPQEFNLAAARNETAAAGAWRSRRTDAYGAVYPQNDTAAAAAAGVGARDVWSPTILHPKAGDVWRAGDIVQILWDTSERPEEVTNYMGSVILGHEQSPDGNEHLDFKHPLAEGFNLTQGAVTVVVPECNPSTSYFVVLYGDSGNRSPYFTILERPLIVI